jgi:hypothetical protein
MKLYHGSDYDFDKVNTKIGKGLYGYGFYTTNRANRAKEYGENLYEFNYQGGKFFNPENFTPNQQQREQLLKDYSDKIMFSKKYDPTSHKILIDEFYDRYFNDEGKVFNATDFLDLLSFLGKGNESSSSDPSVYMKKLGLDNYQGLQIPLWKDADDFEDYYVVFDPKTLKMVRKTKVEE